MWDEGNQGHPVIFVTEWKQRFSLKLFYGFEHSDFREILQWQSWLFSLLAFVIYKVLSSTGMFNVLEYYLFFPKYPLFCNWFSQLDSSL